MNECSHAYIHIANSNGGSTVFELSGPLLFDIMDFDDSRELEVIRKNIANCIQSFAPGEIHVVFDIDKENDHG